jgi:hypothetical protein
LSFHFFLMTLRLLRLKCVKQNLFNLHPQSSLHGRKQAKTTTHFFTSRWDQNWFRFAISVSFRTFGFW